MPIPPMIEGLLLVDKPKGKTSFSLIVALRKILGMKTIGHAGTLDPMATGVMVLLLDKRFTKQSNQVLSQDKVYLAEITLGISTDSYDADGQIIATSSIKPTLEQLQNALTLFQGTQEQLPPMFSAKKVRGKKLYEWARQGEFIERAKTRVSLVTSLINYEYPKITLRIACSKGTYVRSIAHDLGEQLACGAHLSALRREKSGPYNIDRCFAGELLFDLSLEQAKAAIMPYLQREL